MTRALGISQPTLSRLENVKWNGCGSFTLAEFGSGRERQGLRGWSGYFTRRRRGPVTGGVGEVTGGTTPSA